MTCLGFIFLVSHDSFLLVFNTNSCTIKNGHGSLNFEIQSDLFPNLSCYMKCQKKDSCHNYHNPCFIWNGIGNHIGIFDILVFPPFFSFLNLCTIWHLKKKYNPPCCPKVRVHHPFSGCPKVQFPFWDNQRTKSQYSNLLLLLTICYIEMKLAYPTKSWKVKLDS